MHRSLRPLASLFRKRQGTARFTIVALVMGVLTCGLTHSKVLAQSETPEVSSATARLLKTFRDEFVEIRPGHANFPTAANAKLSGPLSQSKLPAKFLVAKYEVPQNLWTAVTGQNPSRWKGARNSVEMLTFRQAEQFCQQATDLMRQQGLIGSNQSVRLPTEAEWEYCARAGTSTAYSFGDRVDQLTQYAWFTDNAAGNDPPVGAKRPNPWGLYDVHGYLWEWCSGSEQDGNAVLRGGSWKDPAKRLTSSYRRVVPKHTKDDAIGLRCVLAATKVDSLTE